MDDKQVTTNEIMEFLQDHMVMREEFESRFNLLDVKINKTKLDLIDVIDEKIGALRGDLIVTIRNEDKKLTSLVQLLVDEKVLDDRVVKPILIMQPFPQLYVSQ